MSESIRIGNRGRQILNLLHQHGPLLSSTIREVIEPKMKYRDLRASIQRLRLQGLVKNRHSSVKNCAGRFIELSNDRDSKKLLSDTLQVPEASLKNIPGNTEALEHWQECAIWAKRFEKIFPEARMVRDFQLVREPELMKEAYLTSTDGGLLPDILLIFPRIEPNRRETYVAIEIERSQKSYQRIRQKLRRYAGESNLSTVLYICSRPKVAAKVMATYLKGIHNAFIRVDSYSENFLQTLESEHHHSEELLPFNAVGKNVHFKNWVEFLCRNSGTDLGKFSDYKRTS